MNAWEQGVRDAMMHLPPRTVLDEDYFRGFMWGWFRQPVEVK